MVIIITMVHINKVWALGTSTKACTGVHLEKPNSNKPGVHEGKEMTGVHLKKREDYK